MTLMPEDSCDRLLDGCEIVGKAAIAAQVSMWEVFATQSYGYDIEIERGRVSLAAGGGDGGYGIRVIEDGRPGFAYAATAADAGDAVAEAVRASTLVPAIEGFELPQDQGATEVAGMWDPEVDQSTPEELMEQADSLLQDVCEADSRAMISGGGVSVSCHAAALLSSQGISTSGMMSSHDAGIQVSIDEDDRITSGWSSMCSRSLIPDFSPICEESVDWAVQTRATISIDAAAEEAPVLFTHRGIGSLFRTIVCPALRGEKLARKESLWTGKEGCRIIESHLSIVDDGTIEGASGSSKRDGEGLKTRATSLVEGGILKSGLWSTRDSAEQVSKGNVEHAESTGNAGRGGHSSPPSTSVSNLVLTSSAANNSRHQLIDEMEEGYIVQSMMGAHTANPSSGDFSTTSSSILKIKDGTVVGSLKQAGLSGNLPKAFNEGVSLAHMQAPRSQWAGGSVIVPDLLLRQGIRINPS